MLVVMELYFSNFALLQNCSKKKNHAPFGAELYDFAGILHHLLPFSKPIFPTNQTTTNNRNIEKVITFSTELSHVDYKNGQTPNK